MNIFNEKFWFFNTIIVLLQPVPKTDESSEPFIGNNSLAECTQSLGLTGFDSGQEWYVSTRRLVGYLLNPSEQKINWRKQLRSRCLIEVQ